MGPLADQPVVGVSYLGVAHADDALALGVDVEPQLLLPLPLAQLGGAVGQQLVHHINVVNQVQHQGLDLELKGSGDGVEGGGEEGVTISKHRNS